MKKNSVLKVIVLLLAICPQFAVAQSYEFGKTPNSFFVIVNCSLINCFILIAHLQLS